MRYITRRVDLIKSKDNIKEDSLIWNKDACREFVSEYLKSDGVFILRMLCTNSGDYVTTEVIHGLWYYYEMRSKQPIFLDRFVRSSLPGIFELSDGSHIHASSIITEPSGRAASMRYPPAPRGQLPPYDIMAESLRRRRKNRNRQKTRHASDNRHRAKYC
ncbi:hypothetical protein ACOME3_006789 [Neoechinorhynchus agilis]